MKLEDVKNIGVIGAGTPAPSGGISTSSPSGSFFIGSFIGFSLV